MFRKLRLAALAAFSLLVLASPAQAEWHRAQTKHFIVYANTDEDDLRVRTERLERFDALMRMLFKVEDTVPVQVFMLPSIGDVQRLAGNPNVGGFYNATAQLAYGFVPVKFKHDVEGYSSENVMMHEYAHHMLLGGTDRYVPGWATEGLATMFMTARLDDDGGITLGAPNPVFSREIYRGSRWSIEKMLRSDDEHVGQLERGQLYSRGWALAHYLWFSGERPGEYVKFIDFLNKSGDALESGKQAFGDLKKLNSEVNAYLRRSSFPASRFSAEQLNAPSEMEIRPLTAGEEAILDYRMRSLLGVNEETAPKLQAEALPVGNQYPNDPFVQRAMAEIEYDAKNYAAAGIAADRALAADPDNIMAMAYKGRIAVQHAMEDDTDDNWREARNWFLKANRTEPNHPLPFVLYYDSFRAAGEVPSEGVVGGLYRAVVLVPQDITLRARAAIELIRSDDIKRARSVIAPAAFYPHLPNDNPMRKLVEKIDEGADREALLAYIDDEKFDQLYNEFLGQAAAKELEEKEKSNTAEDD